jgi:hypothetical protein
MDVSEAKRLKALEDENAKLKRLHARVARQRRAEGAAGKTTVTLATMRDAVAPSRGEPRRKRAAGRTPSLPSDRSTLRHRPKRPDDTALRARLRRAGGPALAVRLPPPACPAAKRGLDHKPQEDPAALRRGRAGGTPTVVVAAHRGGAHPDPEAGWPQQPLVDGLRSRPAGERPEVPRADDIDDATRECLAAVPDISLSGKRVVREMNALIARRGRPGAIVSDNGTEVTSSTVLASLRRRSSTGATLLWQAHPERLLRELPGADADDASTTISLLLGQPRPRHGRRLGRRLKHRAPALGDRTHDARRLRRDPESATGIGAAPPRKLRTDALCYRRAHAQSSTHNSSDP